MENQIYYSQKLETSLDMMFDIVEEKRNEYATPEHFLMSLLPSDAIQKSNQRLRRQNDTAHEQHSGISQYP